MGEGLQFPPQLTVGGVSEHLVRWMEPQTSMLKLFTVWLVIKSGGEIVKSVLGKGVERTDSVLGSNTLFSVMNN